MGSQEKLESVKKYSDLEFVGSRQHNASALIGPGQYNLPEIMGSGRC
jgi:hypothetical protein